MKTLKQRVIDYIYHKWIESGWKLVTGIAAALGLAWVTHPYVALYAYEKGYISLADNSWTITALVAIQVVIFLGIIGMAIQVLFGSPSLGKTKFKHK